jgi:cation diffusion facilitator family transporter
MLAGIACASARVNDRIAVGRPASLCYSGCVQVGTGTARASSDEWVRLRAGLLSLVVSIALLGVKYFAYRLTGSSAVLSDALESITNVVAAVFALGGLLFAGRPADRGHPYGHGKIEYFSAVFEGGLIAFAAVLILWQAFQSLRAGHVVHEVDLGIALTVASGAVNAALGWYLLATGRRVNSITLVADGRHVLSDFWTSLGVFVGLLLVRFTGIAWLDPLAAAVVGLNLAVTGGRLVRQAAGGLLDEEDTVLLDRLVRAFDRSLHPGIIRLHRLRAQRAGRFTHVDAHLIVPEYWTVEQAHEATDAFAEEVLAACTVEGEIIFHTDPCRRALCAICDVEGCPVRVEPFRGRPPLTLSEATATDEDFWRGVHRPPTQPPSAYPAAS